ncbi:MAG: acetate uptake transporter family protein [Mycobacteriales bacterium]
MPADLGERRPPPGMRVGAHAAAEPAATRLDPAEQALNASRIFLRPIADPMSLGFLGLAGATLTVAGLELGWIPASQQHQAALIVILFTPGLQLIGSVFGFLGRDPVAATGMGVLAGSWAVIGALLLANPPGRRSAALGTFLMLVTVAILLSALTAAHSKLLPAGVLALAGVRFAFTGTYQLSGIPWVRTGAGVVGCILALLAVYAAVALELEGQQHRSVLPTLRRHPQEALSASLAEQVRRVASEPGVRTGL